MVLAFRYGLELGGSLGLRSWDLVQRAGTYRRQQLTLTHSSGRLLLTLVLPPVFTTVPSPGLVNWTSLAYLVATSTISLFRGCGFRLNRQQGRMACTREDRAANLRFVACTFQWRIHLPLEVCILGGVDPQLLLLALQPSDVTRRTFSDTQLGLLRWSRSLAV